MDFDYFILIEVMVILHISASEKILASQYLDVNSGLSKDTSTGEYGMCINPKRNARCATNVFVSFFERISR